MNPMKRFFLLICALALILPMVISCSKFSSRRYDYDLSEYVELKEYKKIKAEFEDPTVCTEEEVDKALFEVMLTYADFTDKGEEGRVELYNQVKMEYSVLCDGSVVADSGDEEFTAIVGISGYEEPIRLLLEAMIGGKVGEYFEVEYTYPEDQNLHGSFAGKTVQCGGTIFSVYQHRISEITDEFVQSFEDFGFQTVQDFRDQLREDILKSKEEAKAGAVLNAFLAGITVKKYPDAEVQAYMDKFREEVRDAAEDAKVSYEEYIETYLNTTKEDFESEALENAKERVKVDMACIQVSRLLEVELTEEEYEKGLQGYYESEAESFSSAEEFEEYFTKDILWDCIRWDKTFLILVDNAERIES
jgi:FKBP-type peptidyl-prolyl cis-trans isomerase (trigger factor)